MKFRKLHPEAKTPVRAHPLDAGLDLFCLEGVRLVPGVISKIRTGIAIDLGIEGLPFNRPEDSFAQAAFVMGKSGLAAKGVLILGGVIDETYQGEIIVIATLVQDSELYFRPGDKIAQLIVHMVATPTLEEYDGPVVPTDRGDKGFGSTGG